MMVTTLQPVADDETRRVLHNFFIPYFYDLSAYDPNLVINRFGLPMWAPIGGEGPGTPDEFIAYNWWIRDQCRSFIIRSDGAPAGFVIVNAGPEALPPGVDYDVQDFYVTGKYRRRGVGRAAARQAFDLFRGRWEVVQLADNAAAIAFWQQVIAEYTEGHFELLDDGARQRFRNDGHDAEGEGTRRPV